jgi:hypothetical protein
MNAITVWKETYPKLCFHLLRHIAVVRVRGHLVVVKREGRLTRIPVQDKARVVLFAQQAKDAVDASYASNTRHNLPVPAQLSKKFSFPPHLN